MITILRILFKIVMLYALSAVEGRASFIGALPSRPDRFQGTNHLSFFVLEFEGQAPRSF